MTTSDINTKTKEGRLLVAAIMLLTNDITESQAVLDRLYHLADLEFEPAEDTPKDRDNN